MRDVDWVNFIKKAALTTLRYMIFGAIIMAGIGILIALSAALFGGAGPLSLEYVAEIAWSYAKIGLFGGGLIGLLYGLLAQAS
jgi:hypothetical protein